MAKRYNGQRTPGSGSGWRIKGDVRAHDFLFEAKSCESRTQITIKLSDLVKVEKRALQSGRVPVLTFDIGRRRYQVLTDPDFAELTGVDTDGGS